MEAAAGRHEDGTGDPGAERLARALGWFSVVLGAAQVAAPGAVNRLIGVEDTPQNRRVVVGPGGLREVTVGAGILTATRSAGWLWGRVAGDVGDLGLLGAAFTAPRSERRRVLAVAAAVTGVTAIDVVAALRMSRANRTTELRDAPREEQTMQAKAVITVNRPPEEVYCFWRDLENLPRFMAHVESVKTNNGASHWTARGPAGSTVEWDAEIVDDTPNSRIAWRSVEGADVGNAGSVRFEPAPAGQGTEVTVELRYDPPGGAIGSLVAKLLGEEPLQQIRDDLRRFKQVLETGEVVRSEATYDGTNMLRLVRQRPAQPLPSPRDKES